MSAAIDEVWHAHLSFPKIYQCNIQHFFLLLKTYLLGYSPVLNLELHYEAAFKEIHTMLEGTGEAVDDKFWPA
jgi:hypothetical protein